MEVHARSSFRHPYRQVETFHSQVCKSAYNTGMVRPRCTPCTLLLLRCCAFKLTDSNVKMEYQGKITFHFIPKMLYMFQLSGTTDFGQTAYGLHSCVIHLGARPDSGHYRAVLWDPDGQMWMCDDNEYAKSASVDDIALCHRSCYTFMYSKLEGA